MCPLKGGKHHGALDRCDDPVRAGGAGRRGGWPLVKLNGTIARLSAMLEHVLHRLDMLEGEDRNLRRKWEETQCQLGGRVSHCENRLSLLEQKGGAYESH